MKARAGIHQFLFVTFICECHLPIDSHIARANTNFIQFQISLKSGSKWTIFGGAIIQSREVTVALTEINSHYMISLIGGTTMMGTISFMDSFPEGYQYKNFTNAKDCTWDKGS
jgi:hypothetical protein